MKKKKKVSRHHVSFTNSFSEFLQEPHIAMAILIIGLVALVLAILEFTQALNY